MSDKERYEELLETIKILRHELELARSNRPEPGKTREAALFREVFHSAPQLMAVSNLETGVYEDVNDTFLKTLGFEKDEIIGKTSQDIQLFADIAQSDKFIRVLRKFRKVRDVEVILRTKSGTEKKFLFSADTLLTGNEPMLLTYYTCLEEHPDIDERKGDNSLTREVFDTISNYIALFMPVNDRFMISDFNHRAAEIEFIDKKELIGKFLDQTPLVRKTKLIEILHYVNITREPYKLAASPEGDYSQGFYTAFLLSSGEIVVTWEPSPVTKTKEKNYIKQGQVFERFAEMLPIVIFELDLKGRVTYINPRGLDFFGYSQEDLSKGGKLTDFFGSDIRRMLTNLKSLDHPDQSLHNEYYVYKKSGEKIPIATHTFAIFADGVVTGYRGIVLDYREHKKYQQEIEKEKAFLEQFIDSTPEAIAIANLDGIVVRINKEFTRLFGYEPTEAIGNHIDNLIVPDDLKEEAILIDKLSAETSQEVRYTVRKDKWGNTIHVNLVASKVVFNGKAVANVGIYRDDRAIRKTRLMQEVLYNLSTQALKMVSLNDFYRIIIEEVSKIWDTNNFFIALYNKETDTLSLPIFSDEKDKFDEVPASKTISKWVMKTGKSVILKDDDIKELELTGEINLVGTLSKVWLGVPLKEGNEIIGVMCLQDYNDENKFSHEDLGGLEFIANQIAIAIQRKTNLDNLIIARKSAEEASLAKQQFMSTMSHEIRTPLNEVIGFTNLLL